MMQVDSVPARYVVDIRYANSMFLTDLLNLITPEIESNSYLSGGHFTNEIYEQRLHHVLFECGYQVFNILEFSELDFVNALTHLPSMTTLDNVVSLKIPVRLVAFRESFARWALMVRAEVLNKIGLDGIKYHYIMEAMATNYVVIAKYIAPPTDLDIWNTIL